VLLVIWMYFGDMHADGFGAEAVLKKLPPHPHPRVHPAGGPGMARIKWYIVISAHLAWLLTGTILDTSATVIVVMAAPVILVWTENLLFADASE
jgi:hypothetical protein